MSDTRRLSISCEATFGNVDMVRAAVNGVCTSYFHLACNAESVMDFCLIVTELMNNAVEHAEAGVLDVEILLTDQEATFRLTSAGQGFDPTLTAEMPDAEEDEFPEGGYGLPLIQALADDMEYERRENRNMVTLRKRFPETSGKEQ